MAGSKLNRTYHWIPDVPDIRDYPFAATFKPDTLAKALPPLTDLRAKMSKVEDQKNLGCHDDKTEVLTEKGFVRWPDYNGTDLLATISPTTHLMEFQAPVALQQYEFKGQLYKVEHRSLDFALTPNHRMYQQRWNQKAKTLSSEFSFRTIDQIGWYAGLLAAPSGHVGVEFEGIRIGARSYSGDDFLALVSLLASDGWTAGTDANRGKNSFCCFREDRIGMVREFANRMGFHELPGRPGVWQWNDPDLAAWLRANLYTGDEYRSPFKRIPDLVKVASKKQIKHFLGFFGDQHCAADGNGQQFYTSSHRMLDDLQELHLKLGKRSGIYERPPRDATMPNGRVIDANHCVADLTLTVWDGDQLSITRKKNLYTEDYAGPVFCATVPNSTLITRRNGAVLISGNSCTANALAGSLECLEGIKKQAMVDVSRLFIYYNERAMEGTVRSDSGAVIRDGIKTLSKQGACLESIWPYTTSKFAIKPPPAAYQDGLNRKIKSYHRLSTLTDMKTCLASGFPFVFGFAVYDSFESDVVAKTGVVPMPSSGEGYLGGHAVCAVGYDDSTQRMLVRNSWGTAWGIKGYFTMPYDYLVDRNLSDDLWTIQN